MIKKVGDLSPGTRFEYHGVVFLLNRSSRNVRDLVTMWVTVNGEDKILRAVPSSLPVGVITGEEEE